MAGNHLGGLKYAARAAGITFDEYVARIAAGVHPCTRCKTWKPRADFGNDKSRADGCDRSCSVCRRVKVRKVRKGLPSSFRGKTHTAAARAKMSAAHKGKTNRLGIKHTAETRAKISAITKERTPRGADHYAYRNGAFQRNLSLRRRPEYIAWRNAVFARDNYTCKDCGDQRGGNLRAHHHKPMAEHPELAYDVGNGVTLCHPCHELRHYKPGSIRNQRKLKRGERLWK